MSYVNWARLFESSINYVNWRELFEFSMTHIIKCILDEVTPAVTLEADIGACVYVCVAERETDDFCLFFADVACSQ